MDIVGEFIFTPVGALAPRWVDKRTRFRQRDQILELFGYRYCHAEQRQALEAKARQAARVCSQPI